MPKRFPDRAIGRFLPAMLACLDTVLKPGEDCAAFILAATAAALRKAEAAKKAATGWTGCLLRPTGQGDRVQVLWWRRET